MYRDRSRLKDLTKLKPVLSKDRSEPQFATFAAHTNQATYDQEAAQIGSAIDVGAYRKHLM